MSVTLADGKTAASKGILPLFAVTLFVSAFLVFLVQPMFAKMVLPLLGGAPGVWNTAMMFFQGALLAGYAYAHLAARTLPPRLQVLAHLGVLALGFLSLPIAVAAGWAPPGAGSPIPWLVALFAVSVGLPFLAVSATAPLLQSWFARSGHWAASDPYFLYAASNLGSILALLAYPVLIEPLMPTGGQSLLWTAAYALLLALIALCGLFAGSRPAPRFEQSTLPGTAPGWADRLRWVLLAFAPSSLLLGVTAFIATDVASAPLLWVVPLTLYLLSFVIVFARRPVLRHEWAVAAQPFVFIPLAIFYTFGSTSRFELAVPLHLAAFFVAALVCHGELAARRPAARHLTGFYLWMSFGGVLGGVFNAILAPTLFNGVWEYPIALVLACALRPVLMPGRRTLDVVLPLLLFGFLVLPALLGTPLAHMELWAKTFFLVVAGIATYAFSERPVRFALAVAALLAVGSVGIGTTVLLQSRSFFGVYKVEDDARGLITLVHGTTLHGGRYKDDARRSLPITYYSPSGPVGDFFAPTAPPLRIAVVGLGTGTLACWTRPQDRITFYEIDPAIEALARDTRYFHFLGDCRPDAPVILGDARLKLAEAEDGAYDRIIVDAFSSDAIPVHLLTREAVELYFSKLAPGGLLALHISNRHLALDGVVAALAGDAGLVAIRRNDPSTPEGLQSMSRTRSEWAVLARRAEDVAWLADSLGWKRLKPGPDARLWTDDYSDIVGALRWLKE